MRNSVLTNVRQQIASAPRVFTNFNCVLGRRSDTLMPHEATSSAHRAKNPNKQPGVA